MKGNDFIRTFWNVWFYFLYWCYHYAWRLGLYNPPVKKKTILEQDKTFYENKIERFRKFLDANLEQKNASINPLFYNKKEFKTFMEDPENILEKEWIRRVYYVNTPRGPISMHFDAFKLAFSYYCDQSVVSYDVLNACAMDYVRMFSCMDFFQDELILNELKSEMTPLYKIHYSEESSENPEKKPEKKQLSKAFHVPQTKNARNSMSDYFKERFALNEEKKPPNKLVRNRFVHLGKITNWSIIQPSKKKVRSLQPFKSGQLEGIVADSEKKKMSWLEYKKNAKMNAEPKPETLDITPLI